jgi:hypothetical protein
MAIIEEAISAELIKRYSDRGMLIEQVETGDRYAEAIDLIDSPIHYVETNIPIDSDEESTEADYAEAGKILLGEVHE